MANKPLFSHGFGRNLTNSKGIDKRVILTHALRRGPIENWHMYSFFSKIKSMNIISYPFVIQTSVCY